MAIIYLILFCAICAIALFDKYKDKYVTYIYIGTLAVLVLIAGFRPYEHGDKDISNYLAFFYNPDAAEVEFSFKLLAEMADALFGSPRALFVAYALLAIPLKGFAITRLTQLWYLSILMWLSHYFLLNEMTQIRVAVSMAIFLYSLPLLAEGKKLLYVLCVAVATFFHTSALALLPLVFFGNKELGKYWKITLYTVPAICAVMHGIEFDLLRILPIPYIQERIEDYESLRDHGVMGDEELSFTLYYVKMLAYLLLLVKYDVLKDKVKYLPLLMKIFALSFLCYTLFSFLPILAARSRELYGIVEIVLIPYLVYVVKPVNAGKIVVIVYATLLCITDLFVHELIG